MSQRLLDLPAFPDWVTSSSRRDTAAEVGYSTEFGWGFRNRAQPYLLNYMQYLNAEWNKRHAYQNLATINSDNAYFGSSNMTGVARIPPDSGLAGAGLWVATINASGNTYVSWDGFKWAAGPAIGATPYPRAIMASNEGVIVATPSDLYLLDNDTAWTNIGGVGGECIANVEGSDKFIVGKSGSLYRWETGVTGGEVVASTGALGGGNAQSVAGKDLDNWILLVSNGRVNVSTDGGDNWVATTQMPVDVLPAITWETIDCDGDTAIVVGSTGEILRSADFGQSWSAVTKNFPSGNGTWNIVKALGNNRWVVGGDDVYAAAGNVIDYIYSIDDGVTWYVGHERVLGGESDDIEHIYCDGARILGVGSTGTIISTDATQVS